MTEPKFSLTFRILNTLSSIERLYGQLTTKQLIPSLALKLTEENQILATHYSTSIEGNPLSPQDVTNVVLGDTVATTKSQLEVKNYFAVLNHVTVLGREHKPITTEVTLVLHKKLMDGIMKEAGKFRDGPVFVGHKENDQLVVKHNPPYHDRNGIEAHLSDLYDWLNEESPYHPLLKAGILHHQFAYIHPFFDGNGRMARILTTYFLLLKQYEVAKYFILDDYYDVDRPLYSDSLHTADAGDETMWLEYFLEGIEHSLRGALARIDELTRSHLDRVTGEKRVLVSQREEEVLQILIEKKAIRSSDIEHTFEVSRQHAHGLLSSLVTKGLVKKYGSTKSSYYKLTKSASSS